MLYINHTMQFPYTHTHIYLGSFFLFEIYQCDITDGQSIGRIFKLSHMGNDLFNIHFLTVTNYFTTSINLLLKYKN